MYKISIIIPVYNDELKIYDAFNSILNQTFNFDDLEIIFVDDASTDNSTHIIKSLAEEYENIKAICLDENSGFAGRPRNVGMKYSTAPYIMFLDSDDTYYENACAILYENIVKNDLDMVSGNYVLYLGNQIFNKSWRNIDLVDNELLIQSYKEQPDLFYLPCSVWSKIFKKEFLLKNNLNYIETIPAQDVLFVYSCLFKAKGIKYIDVPIVKYVPGVKNTSITSTRNKKNLLNYLNAYYLILDVLRKEPDYEKYIWDHMNFWTTNLILSEISHKDKIDLLRVAHDLYAVYQKHNLKPKKDLIKFFNLVFSKHYIDAVCLSDELAVNLNDDVLFNKVKDKDILIISNKELYDLFKKNGYSTKLINLDEKTDSIDSINIYEYYSNGNYTVKCNGNIKKFYDDNDFNFLIIKDNLVKLNYSSFYLLFNNILEFYEYFITEIIFLSNEKPFLIMDKDLNLNINSKIVYSYEYCENIEINYWLNLFKESYLNEHNVKYAFPVENDKLKKENNKLKEKLKNRNNRIKELKESRDYYIRLNNEMVSSNSWKITKPLRIINRNLKTK